MLAPKPLLISGLLSTLLAGCGGGSAGGAPPPPPAPVWQFSGVFGGYVPRIVFHPSHACEVWASADDMGGLYRSTDCGSTWSRVATVKNFSSYSLMFDPNDASTIVAASHFGWGLLKSVDAGAHWTLSQAGLPSSGTAKHVYQVAIKPGDSTRILAATESGLYRSTDAGTGFTNLNLAWATGFRAVVYLPSGRLLAGAANGAVKYSDDDGSSWSDLFTGAVPVTTLAASANAIYYLFDDGSLVYTSLDLVSSAGTLNSSLTGIACGVVAPALAVASGATRASDLIYLGTSRNPAVGSSRWGLFKSADGGATWTQQQSGVAGHSIFSVAIDRADTNRVLAGTSDSAGLFRTTDGGATWSGASTGFLSSTVLGFAQNPLQPGELVMSSTVGFGLGKTYHSNDSAGTWSVVPEVDPEDGVLAFDFDPSSAGTVLAGMVSKGLYRSTTGVTGAWSRVIPADVKIGYLRRDRANPSIVYALALGGTNPADVRIHYSSDGGATFTPRPLFLAFDLAPHPTRANEAVMVTGNGVYASTDGFASGTLLGLTSEAGAQTGLSAVAFNPANPAEVWVGGAAGGLFRTTNYRSSGAGVTWSPVTSPISNAMVKQLLVRTENSVKTVYVSSFAGDVNFAPGAVLGLWRSTDDGLTWTSLSATLEPCTAFWSFSPVLGSPTDLWGGMWGGGLFRLSYR